MLSVSSDSYVRLSQAALDALPLAHLISGLDEGSGTGADTDGVADITGYTEWTCAIAPAGAAISIGWDWRMLGSGEGIALERVGDPRSNLMIYDNSKIDSGQINTLVKVCIFVDSLHWQRATLDYLAQRYPCQQAAR